jgi:hypothetical protein
LKNEKDLIEIAEQEGKIKAASSDEGDSKKDEMEESKCGSCYGAGEDGECCDSCEDVRRAYKRRGWILRPEVIATIEQCQNEVTESDDDQEGEGCNLHGVVALSTGGGNLHLAPGKEAAISGMTVLDVLMQSFQQWNVSHTIHKIRFGPEYPDAIYQLDGESRSIQDTYGMYQYYFQVKKWRVRSTSNICHVSSVFTQRNSSFLYTINRLCPPRIGFSTEQQFKQINTALQSICGTWTLGRIEAYRVFSSSMKSVPFTSKSKMDIERDGSLFSQAYVPLSEALSV